MEKNYKITKYHRDGNFLYYGVRVPFTFLGKKDVKFFEFYTLDNIDNEVQHFLQKKKIEEQKFVNQYNKIRNDKIDNIFDKNLLKKDMTIDWEYEKQKKRIIYNKFSTDFIIYNDKGYPIKYFCLNDKKEYLKEPNKPLHPNWTLPFYIFSSEDKIKQKYLNYHQEMKDYKNNQKRYDIFLKEQEQWIKTYNSYIDEVEQNYNKTKEKEVKIYYKLIIINLEFNIKFKSNFTLDYSSKDKILKLDYTLPSRVEEDIKNLLIGYFKNQNNEYEMMFYHKREYNRRLNHIWNQIIYIIIYKLYQADKVNAIDKIYFNGKINSNETYIELIINKDKFNKYKLNSYEEFFDKFNKDLVYIESLVNEGIYVAEYNQVFNYQKDNYYNLFNDRIIELCIQEEGDLSSKNIHMLTKFNKLERLIIKNQNLDAIPIEIFSMTSLVSINFQSNKIKKISQEIEKLINLKRIDFSNNQITEFPSFILNLKFLQSLLLTNNFIKNIDIEILKKISSSSLLKLNLEQNPIMNNIKKDKEFDEPKRIVAKLIAKEKRPKKNQEITYQKEEKVLNNVNSINIDLKKPLIITEGKTDKTILEIAWGKLYNKKMPFEIQSSGVEIEEEKREGSADSVKRTIELMSGTFDKNRILIGLFDNDMEGNINFKGLTRKAFEKYNIALQQRKHLTKNIYALLLPVPKFRKIFVSEDDIGQRMFVIEHYFTNEVLQRFQMKGKSLYGSEVFKVNNGKAKFAKNIEKLDKKEFENFKLIFDVIEKIIKE